MREARRALPVALVIAATAVVGTAAAEDDTPPVVSKLKVLPTHVCRKKSATCGHPGGTVTFTLSEYAKVVAATRPLNTGRGAVVLFKKKVGAGRHSRRFSVQGLPTGRYTMQLSAIDPASNASHPIDQTYYIVK